VQEIGNCGFLGQPFPSLKFSMCESLLRRFLSISVFRVNHFYTELLFRGFSQAISGVCNGPYLALNDGTRTRSSHRSPVDPARLAVIHVRP